MIVLVSLCSVTAIILIRLNFLTLKPCRPIMLHVEILEP